MNAIHEMTREFEDDVDLVYDAGQPARGRSLHAGRRHLTALPVLRQGALRVPPEELL